MSNVIFSDYGSDEALFRRHLNWSITAYWFYIEQAWIGMDVKIFVEWATALHFIKLNRVDSISGNRVSCYIVHFINFIVTLHGVFSIKV